MSDKFEDIKKYKALWEMECQKNINLRGENRVLTSLLEEIEETIGKYKEYNLLVR